MLCCCTACFLHTHTQYLTFHWDRPEQWATGLFTADDSLFVLSSATTMTTKTCVCVCELLSRRNRAVAVYYVFIYVFHPLIDTLRRRLRRTYVYYIQHCCQHLRRCSIAFYPTPSACFENEPTYPLRIYYSVPFRSKGEVATGQFYPSSHINTISKSH